MSSQQIDLLVDDIDGTASHRVTGAVIETVPFMLDGVSYEITLKKKNAEVFRAVLAPVIAHARPKGSTRAIVHKARAKARARANGAANGASANGTRANGHAQVDPNAVREWAKEHGIDVKDRGRIAAPIISQYLKAHS